MIAYGSPSHRRLRKTAFRSNLRKQADLLCRGRNPSVSGRHLEPRANPPGQYPVEGFSKNSQLAREQAIVAIRTLVRELSIPIGENIGNLSDERKVLIKLKVE